MKNLLRLAVCFWLVLLESAAEAQRPNVLFIAVDDLRVELGCYGSAHVKSPHIDKLASQATLFQRAYCQQTVCNPSRASLLTGMRPDTLRVWDLPTHFRQNKPDAVRLTQLFKRSGYHAQCIGKISHNWRQDDCKGDPASWSVPSILHYNSHGNDKPRIDGQLPPNLESGEGGIECRDVPDDAYFDGRVADNANPRRRDPLTLAISPDGLVFTHLFNLVGGRHIDYPHIIDYDDHPFIAFSSAKQTIEVLKVSLDNLDRLLTDEPTRN